MTSRSNRPVVLWLFACCGMIFIMAILGAITRLTESGLSITDWNPIMGALPPLNEAAWNEAFAAYKQIPQYQILNSGMTLGEFKNIYFWEWLHRLWGRLIGLVFAVPLIWFFIRKQIDKKLALKLLAIFALGGLQGFIGWFMVQSGLDVRTSVSPYRLALHLGLALLLYGLLLWTALGLMGNIQSQISKGISRYGWATLGILVITIIWGALVAGLRAGEAYNTWPLMDGQMLPDAAFTLIPKWLNIFENLALVQFIHRWLGPATMIMILAWVWSVLQSEGVQNKGWLIALGLVAMAQVALGITTLLTHTNIILATLHQAGAITLLTLLLINLKTLYPVEGNIFEIKK